MSYDNAMKQALRIDAQLRARMRDVRETLPQGASLAELEAAWQSDIQCQALLAESKNAWAQVEAEATKKQRRLAA